MNRVAHQHAQGAGKQTDQRKLQRVAQCNGALAQAQHAQHGAIIQMTRRKTARSQCHGDSAQQGRQEGHQVQELLGPVHGSAHLGAASLQRLQPHAAHLRLLYLFQSPFHKGLNLPRLPGHSHSVGQAAGRLDQTGRGHIGFIDHDARRKVHEACTAIWLDHDDRADAKARITQQQCIAHLEIQRFQQRSIDPGLARFGDVTGFDFGAIWLVSNSQIAAQRIARIDNFECD